MNKTMCVHQSNWSKLHNCCLLKNLKSLMLHFQEGLKSLVSRSQLGLMASREPLKSLVLQKGEGAVSFIQLFSTSTSVCQGGGKRRLNTLCNSTRPDAVLLRFNVPFFCLCRRKRLAGCERTKRASLGRGQGEMRREREKSETSAARPGFCHTIEVFKRGVKYSSSAMKKQCNWYSFFVTFCLGCNDARFVHPTYLRKRSSGWSSSVCLATRAMNYVSSL